MFPVLLFAFLSSSLTPCKFVQMFKRLLCPEMQRRKTTKDTKANY